MRGEVCHHAFGCLCFALSGYKRFTRQFFNPVLLTLALYPHVHRHHSVCWLIRRRRRRLQAFNAVVSVSVSLAVPIS